MIDSKEGGQGTTDLQPSQMEVGITGDLLLVIGI